MSEKKNDVKGTWKILNSLIKGSNTVRNYPEKFYNDNKCVTNKKDIANGFNNFFTNVGPSLASKIVSPVKDSIHKTMSKGNINSMFLKPVSDSELWNIFNACKNKRSTDVDDLSMDIVKSTVSVIIKPFVHICNLSFCTGVFPRNMKIAKIIPLFKSGDDTSFTNYRPVSLLPQFSKVLEKLFDKRLTDFIEKYNILSNSQYGFRKDRSTSLALLDFMEKLSSGIDKSKVTVGVFIDLKKAFDTIDHTLLIDKLKYYGTQGIASNWLKSYLSQRKQLVNFNNVYSDQLDVICRVPQGSILGPKLFILYINDICNISKLLNFIIFADDTNIFCTGNNLEETCKLISIELKKLQTWFALNKLSLNVTKTNFMVFGKKFSSRDCQVTINEFKIDRVYVTKFLGVQIDAELSWKPHATEVKNKVYKSLAILKKVKKSLNKDTMLKIYCAIVQSHLSYCVEIWGNCSKVLLSPIIKAQKVAIRLVCNLGFRDHTSSSFKSLKVLKFTDIVKFKLQLLMFNAWNVKLPVNIQRLFNGK